jgi:hypothetical protein
MLLRSNTILDLQPMERELSRHLNLITLEMSIAKQTKLQTSVPLITKAALVGIICLCVHKRSIYLDIKGTLCACFQAFPLNSKGITFVQNRFISMTFLRCLNPLLDGGYGTIL